MVEFAYQDPFPLSGDDTEYRLLTRDYVARTTLDGNEILKIDPEGLAYLAHQAMRDVSFLLRRRHNEQVAAILGDPEASDNDRGVAIAMLRNAEVSAKFELPFCQDTGTAIILGKKGQRVWTGCRDEEFLSEGVWRTYTEENLRYSQTVALDMYRETNSGCNLPAQIDLYATEGDAYTFLFIAKGGGSANKTYLFQETKALLNPESLEAFLTARMKTLGTAACPPYHLAFVVGGTSAESTLKTVKLASAGYLDTLPTTGNQGGRAFRDPAMEARLLEAAQRCGIGAQFGGKYFAHDVRVIRLPRHGASCPVGIGVSCSADRQSVGKITSEGVFVEQLETDPAKYLPEVTDEHLRDEVVHVDLTRPMSEIRSQLSQYPVRTRLSLTGPMIVARDIAHAKLKERIDRGEGLPQYVKDHPIYYAGPAKTPDGMPSGSFGPTTAGRMDSYVDLFMQHGGSFITLAKGNRSDQVRKACATHGGFYLGSIGGPAAILAQDAIKRVEVLEYPELGMEAIWRIEVEDFPAFIITDDKGNDFFADLL